MQERGWLSRAERKPTRTRRVRSGRGLQLGEEARLTVGECKNKTLSFDAHFLLHHCADVVIANRHVLRIFLLQIAQEFWLPLHNSYE